MTTSNAHGPKPKPKALQLIEVGKKRPKRRNPALKFPIPVGIRPSMTTRAVKVWGQLSPILDRFNVLEDPDYHSLAMLCQAMADYWDAQEWLNKNKPSKKSKEGGDVPNTAYYAWMNKQASAFNIIKRIGAAFGITPADRSGMSDNIKSTATKEEGILFAKKVG